MDSELIAKAMETALQRGRNDDLDSPAYAFTGAWLAWAVRPLPSKRWDYEVPILRIGDVLQFLSE